MIQKADTDQREAISLQRHCLTVTAPCNYGALTLASVQGETGAVYGCAAGARGARALLRVGLSRVLFAHPMVRFESRDRLVSFPLGLVTSMRVPVSVIEIIRLLPCGSQGVR